MLPKDFKKTSMIFLFRTFPQSSHGFHRGISQKKEPSVGGKWSPIFVAMSFDSCRICWNFGWLNHVKSHSFFLAPGWWNSLKWLVGGFSPYPSEKWWTSSDDFPNIWKNKIHVPNHQPDPMVFLWFSHGFPMVFLWFFPWNQTIGSPPSLKSLSLLGRGQWRSRGHLDFRRSPWKKKDIWFYMVLCGFIWFYIWFNMDNNGIMMG